MTFTRPFAAAKRWLWLRNRRRLHQRELARAMPYPTWCERYDTLDAATKTALRARLAGLGQAREITLVMPLNAAQPAALSTTLRSLQQQMYPQWRLVLSGTGDAEAMQWAAAAQAGDARVVQADAAAVPAEWQALTTAGEVWREHALLLLAEAVALRPDARLVYADHDHIGSDGMRRDPVFKSDWNPELALSHDCVGAPALWRCERARAALSASEHDALLQGSEGLNADAVVHVPHVLLHRPADAPPLDADAQAVARHLARRGISANSELQPFGVRVHFALPAAQPRVSVVIPTRNGLALLRTCVEGVLHKTDYTALEVVIVDNGSDDPACLRYLQHIAQDPRVRVRRDDGPFNYAALNNAAVAECTGDVIALLNNDIEVTGPGWLREMVSLALLPGIGAVGAKLLYGDRSVQHAGVVLGVGGGAGHVLRRLPSNEGGYLGRAQRLQAVSAVTAACLVVRRDLYEAVGGLDAEHFAVAFNDIDFCLRLRKRGLRNLYTPHAVLLHHESVSRGSDRAPAQQQRFAAEQAAFHKRWGKLLQHDPAYNPNLTLHSENAGLADPPRVSLLRPWFDEIPS